MPVAAARLLPLLLLTLAGTNVACAQAPAPARDAVQPAAAAAVQPAAQPGDPRAAIAAKLELPVEAVRASGITGLYEVVHGADVVFATADGRYVFEGELYDLERQVNVSEERRAQARVAAMARLTDADTIAFGPQDALTRAKAGEELKLRSCQDSRVPADFELGAQLRVRGTPGIFTARGDYIAGYLPPARMLERLQSLEHAANRN